MSAILRINPNDLPWVEHQESADNRHKTDEFFIVTEGSLRLEGIENPEGSVVFIPRETDYAVRAGDKGARYYRVVIR